MTLIPCHSARVLNGIVVTGVEPSAYGVFTGWWVIAIILASTTLMQATQNGGDLWLTYWVDHVDDALHSTSFYLVRLFLKQSIFRVELKCEEKVKMLGASSLAFIWKEMIRKYVEICRSAQRM